MFKQTAVLAFALCLSTVATAAPQTQSGPTDEEVYAAMRELQAQTADEKRVLVQEQLQLDQTQASRFWPIYDEHQKALAGLNERRMANVLAYAKVWNEGGLDERRAAELGEQALAIEVDETDLLKHTYHKLKRVLPATKAVGYLQLENKIRAAVRYQQAIAVPLMP